MQRLPRVLLQMDPDEPDGLPPVARPDLERPPYAERPVVLRDLVSLRKVRVEVVLPREDASLGHLRADGEPDHRGEIDGAGVQRREHAREAEAERADLRVRRRAEAGRAAAEDLGARLELRVDLEPDHRLVALAGRLDRRGPGRAHAAFSRAIGGRRRAASLLSSQARAIRSSVSSSNGFPAS